MKIIISSILFLMAGISSALELPEMSYSDQTGFLEAFPLGKATPLDVINAYGPPRSKMDLSDQLSVWTYYKYDADGVSYVLQFNDGKVYEIVNRYKGFLGPTERKARELQGLK